ncbi:MAG: TIGR04282 family arsenosugar biosynthesis glycosyltransferase, partial [Phycisphaeraceae bacterium]
MPTLPEPSPPTVVVLARRPLPGRVKTRLTARLSPASAAEIHRAMTACTLERAALYLPGPHVLAMDEPGAARDIPAGPAWRVLPQGAGDLGERITRVWDRIGRGPAVFLGGDCPDLPREALAAIGPALDQADVALGPAEDGGYWTLAAARWAPELLAGIDWGTSSVYHQTYRAAERAGLNLVPLPRWRDVDE